ncbi:hypothetical protein PBT90_19600 [Algoriphagus halophytocola]|uniref:Uncharacterized protein n=1 Tax=Algoriphagus halophytocola TaxID=2991499 RepID=A0ABY6MDB7_9BACT|nr:MULTISPECIES: hypothetical protein [unclassified Algoriphagus]UZD21722.1 hypothetical protein OM944_13735 [Algoriphagus sp. TR-M5]WBL42934.1 hypothetical protein PBT90_19600 [Algoriphagus sp. TR-M9]
MKLKTQTVWLFLLPVIGIIGVILYVQATNNQRELENQLIRSIEASKNEIARALGDYYDRVDAYFMQHGAAISATSEDTRSESQKLTKINSFKPRYTNGRILIGNFQPKDSLAIRIDAIFKKDLVINIDSIVNDLNIQNLLLPLQLENNSTTNTANNSDTTLVIDLEIPIVELLRKQETNKIFEQFFLTDESGNIIYPNTEYGVSLFKPKDLKIDTLGVTHAGASMVPISYSEQDSRAYVSPLQINSLKLYAVGVISEDTHQKVGLRLNFTVISIFLLFLAVLIAMIPVLGVMNLSKGDNLTQSKVIQVGLSLLLLSVVIGVAFAQFKNRPDDIKPKIDIVENLAKSLRDSLLIYQGLMEDMILKDKWEEQNGNYNELIWFRENGFVQQIYYRGTNQSLDFRDSPSSVDLSTRVYYSYFHDSRKERADNSVFLNSHYSRFDGELESVISKNYFKNDSLKKEGVRAITFRLTTNADTSENFRFLAFKKSGKILLKSKKITSPIDNINEGINSEKWMEISSLMENNQHSSQEIRTSLYLNGYQYTGILKKIQNVAYDEDIWLLFLVNTNLTHSFASLVSAEALVLVLLYFLSLLFSLVVQKNTRRFRNNHGTKSFLFTWLEPSAANLPRLNYLVISHGLYAVLLLHCYYSFPIHHLHFLALMIYSGFLVSFVNLTTAIGTDPSLDFTEFKLKKYSVRALILGGVVILLLLWIWIKVPNVLKPALLLTGLAAISILLWFYLIKPLKLVLYNENLTLPLFLGIWFLAIGFLPGYFIMSKTQQFEQQIWDADHEQVVADPVQNETTRIYEESRRNSLSLILDPFDDKIRSFIAPNLGVIQNTLDNPQILKPSKWAIIQHSMLVMLFFILFLILAKQLQSIIFFPIQVAKTKPDQLQQKRIFLTCPDSTSAVNHVKNHLDEPESLQVIDLSVEDTLDKIELVKDKKTYLFVNFHCRQDQLLIAKQIGTEKYRQKQVIIASGKTWHETFSNLKPIANQVLFSEAFSDFIFLLLPLDADCYAAESQDSNYPGYVKAKNEEDLRLSLAKFADIWSELNFQEKLVCHEFALERFLNKARINTIKELFKKGILVEKTPDPESIGSDPKAALWKRNEFFSRLFQFYILTHVSEEEIKSFRDFESKNGNSHLIQVSALSFVLICFALIGIFNRSFFDQVYAYLTGSIGLIGSMYTILNSGFTKLKFGKPKEE